MQFKIHNLDIIQQNRKSFTFKKSFKLSKHSKHFKQIIPFLPKLPPCFTVESSTLAVLQSCQNYKGCGETCKN